MTLNLSFEALTADRWNDFVTLFGERGACGGCWCMLWRLSRKQFLSQRGSGNRAAMKAIVDSGEIPGILAYHDGRPVGWCAVAPSASYPALARSRVLAPVDDRLRWSVSCLFVARTFRRKGVSTALLRAAAGHAAARGAALVEGYPVEPRSRTDVPPAFAWTGIASAFSAAGFEEVVRRSPTRPIMRLELDPRQARRPADRSPAAVSRITSRLKRN